MEALRRKILLNHGVETKNVSLEECTNLISGDMAEFQKAKNAQMLPYDEEKWEISYEKLSLGETLGEGHFGKVVNPMKAKIIVYSIGGPIIMMGNGIIMNATDFVRLFVSFE